MCVSDHQNREPFATDTKIVDDLVHYGQMSDEDLQELLEIKRTRAYLLTKQMNEQGLHSIVKRGVNKKYKLK